MLLFDEKGHLTPYTLIPTDWATLVETFGWNQHRADQLDAVYALMKQIQALPVTGFSCWIDGSFVTRKEHPNDVDIVFFLSAYDLVRHETAIR